MVQPTPLVPVDDELVHQQRVRFGITCGSLAKRIKALHVRNEVILDKLLDLLKRGRADAAKMRANLSKLT